MTSRAESAGVQAYLVFDLANGFQRVVDAGRAFFRLGWQMLGYDLAERVEQALQERAYLGFDSSRAVAGGISALCNLHTIDESGRRRERAFVYSPRRFDTLVTNLERNPAFACLDINTWGQASDKGPPRLDEPSLAITWRRNTTKWALPLPDWVLLYVTSSYDHLFGSPQRQAAVVEFLRRVAAPANPACGEVSLQAINPFSAPLEFLLQRERSPRDSMARSRHTVRSYSWVTIISEEIGHRLGGTDALQGSGAFHRVEHLPGGGFLLQATELFEQYQHEQAYRVFRVLAPALPAGVPRAPMVYPPQPGLRMPDEPDWMIVQQDPSSVLNADG